MAGVPVLLGAVTPPGRLNAALEAGAQRAQQPIDIVSLADLKLGFADGRPPEARDDDAQRMATALTGGDGLILASPIYHNWITGAIKNALDLMPRESLTGKRCGVVVLGNNQQYAEAAARVLEEVAAYLGATTAGTPVCLLDTDFTEGKINDEATERLAELIGSVGS